MNLKSVISASCAALLMLSSCIGNDLPYPLVVPSFTSISVQDADTVTVNAVDNTVNIILKEEADIRKVTVGNVAFDIADVRMEPSLNGTFDLSSPMKFTLTTYQDYNWTLCATQPILYSFAVERQIGKATVDDINRRVVAKVSKGTDLSKIKVLDYKFGPRNVSSYSIDLRTVSDFTEPVVVDVTVREQVKRWTVFIEESDVSVDFKSVDAWTRVAWLTAEGVAGLENGFRYRKSGESVWINVPAEQIDVNGGTFSTGIEGLEPLSSYECVAFSGEDTSEIRTFTTEGEQQIPNGGFEIYSNAESNKYYSWWDAGKPACSSKWWDSGNKGSTMVGGSSAICSPDTHDRAEGSSSARLNSRYVVIKFAAGNIFTGEFAGLEGISGGLVDFGRPFSLRPRKLSLMLKYQPGTIDYVNGYPEGKPVSKGDSDRCQVFIALGDWDYKKYGGTQDCPVRVNTTKKETFFNPAGPDVIGYGSYVTDRNTEGWTKVEIPIEYTSLSRVPTHIIISCASSMLGDYFTGSSSSILWLDGMELEY